MLSAESTPSRLHGRGAQWSQFAEYLRRIVRASQMDVEYTFWQMYYLIVDPHRVYRVTSYRKQTKNQWARDDPAFVAILVVFLAACSFAFALAFHRLALTLVLWAMFWTIFVDFLLVGILVATAGWSLCNFFLRIQGGLHHPVDQRVEWLYAFDVHCNSFLPVLLLLYVVQYILLPFLYRPGFVSLILANFIYAVAGALYYRLTFLGYSTLPFLQNTTIFLYPIALIGVLFVVGVLFNLNACVVVMNFYFG